MNFVMGIIDINKAKKTEPLRLEIGNFKVIIEEVFDDWTLIKLCKVLVNLC